MSGQNQNSFQNDVKTFASAVKNTINQTIGDAFDFALENGLSDSETALHTLNKLEQNLEYIQNLGLDIADKAQTHFGSDSVEARTLTDKAGDLGQIRTYLRNRIDAVNGQLQLATESAAYGAAGKIIKEAGGAAYDLYQFLDALFGDDPSEIGKLAFSTLTGLIAAALIPASWGLIATFGVFIGVGLAVDWLLNDSYFAPYFDEIFKPVGEFFQEALKWIPPSDPLTLDLDGDGIETIPADGTVLFDHDADGTKSAIGWIHPDDGMVVMDRNNNGMIDNGLELFGDNTIKSDGSTAKDGFDALSDLDSNSDGLVDSRDVDFSKLRIWRDLNSDGISQSNELFTLNQLGVESISTDGVQANTNVGHGNVAIAEGTFTYSNGSTGQTGAAASLNLATNNFYREFQDVLAIPESHQALPNMQGSGAVRDLRQAATLSSELTSLLNQYSQITTKAGQEALLDQIIHEWALTSGYYLLKDRLDDATIETPAISTGTVNVAAKTWDVEFVISNPILEDDAEFTTPTSSGSGSNGSTGYLTIGDVTHDGSTLRVGAYPDRRDVEVLAKIQMLEVFNNQNFFDFSFEIEDDNQDGEPERFVTSASTGRTTFRRGVGTGSSSGRVDSNVIYMKETDLVYAEAQKVNIERSYAQLRESIYAGLLFQTRLKPYMEAIDFGISDTGTIDFDFTTLNTLLSDLKQSSAMLAYIDLIELNRYAGNTLHQYGWNGLEQLKSWADEAEGNSALESLLVQMNVFNRTDINDPQFRNGLGLENEIILGQAETDRLQGGELNDILYGNDGDDSLYGDAGDDILFGGAGDDYLHGDNGSIRFGDDILDGGAGNDRLDGGYGNDIYKFGRGYGIDTISSYDYSPIKQDAIVFNNDISPEDIAISRVGNSLELEIIGTTDKLIVSAYFTTEDINEASAVDEIRFANGQIWDVDYIKQFVLTGDDNNNTITGYLTDDVITGNAGDDYIYARSGNDIVHGNDGKDSLYGHKGNDQLFGDAGDDYLVGDEGNDILDGGTGNDTLVGGEGNDVYRFGRGYGHDRVMNYNGYGTDLTNKVDAVEFLSDVSPDDVQLIRNGIHLELLIKNTSDKLTLEWYFNNDGNTPERRIEEIRFSDNTVWTTEWVKSQLLIGTSNNDRITGYDSDDSISGNAGDDDIYSRDGNDTIYGGSGIDRIFGDAGDDVIYGGDGDDGLYRRTNGHSGGLMGGEGNDTIYGEAGDDWLSGGNGNDILDGGTGDDTLRGEGGNDTYLFGRGYGTDRIENTRIYGATEETDIIKFIGDILPSDVTIKRENGNGANQNDLTLVVSSPTGEDRLIVKNFFTRDGLNDPGNYYGSYINQIQFESSPDTIWDTNYLLDAALNSATDGNDWLGGYASDDTLNAGAGDDVVYGFDGNDTLDAGSGNDTVYGGEGNDVLNGDDGNDYLVGENGNDILDGGAGNDRLYGGDGNDIYYFGRNYGKDSIYLYDNGTNKLDKVIFKGDILPSEISAQQSGYNLILTLDVNTQLTLEYYFWSNGTDPKYQLEEFHFESTPSEIWGRNEIDTLIAAGSSNSNDDSGSSSSDTNGTVTSETFTGTNGDDVINAGGGNDWVYGQDGNDVLRGGDGNDYLYGRNDNDTLFGEDGNDSLYGDNGNDILDGGAGNDYMGGGYGDDVYHFGLGSGQDTISDYDPTAGNLDVVEFGAGIAPTDIQLSRTGNNLVLSVVGTSDKLTLSNYLLNDGDERYSIEELRFADGTTWVLDWIKETLLVGTSNGETITGYATSDVINAGGGNDWVYGQDGNDVLRGGDGNDYLYGRNDNDTLFGEDGNDSLYGDNGNDILDGGAGNDYMGGGYGDDVYHFGLGSGQDTISDYDPTVGNLDVVEFGAGIAPTDIQLSRTGNNLVLSVVGTSDKLTLSNYLLNDGDERYSIEELRFADGTTWVLDWIKETLLVGTSNGETITGYATSDVINAGGGNDWVYGQDGNDVLRGGDGNDYLYGRNDNDTLFGEDGNDSLYGDNGNDILDGGAGNDYMGGGYGDDIYHFGLGSGQDTISDYDPTAGNLDVVEFGAGIAPTDIQLSRTGNNLVLSVVGTSDKLTLSNYLLNDGDERYSIEELRFADGTTWVLDWIKETLLVGTSNGETITGYATSDVINAGGGNDWVYGQDGNDVLRGGDGNDYLYGRNDNDTLFGEDGNDSLYGDNGNDILDGGAGNDYMSGGYGDDIYHFGLGSGQDTIYDYDAAAGNQDKVTFQSGISANDLWFRKIGNNLEISVIGSEDKLTVSNQMLNANYQVETFELSDGKTLLLNQLDQLVSVMASISTTEPASIDGLTVQQQNELNTAIAAAWQ